jgi:hypothetical protein
MVHPIPWVMILPMSKQLITRDATIGPSLINMTVFVVGAVA